MSNSFILKASPDHSSATVISGESHLQQQQHHQNELDTVVTAALQQLKQGTSNKPLPTEQEQKYNIDTTTCQFKSTTSYIYGTIITVLISKTLQSNLS